MAGSRSIVRAGGRGGILLASRLMSSSSSTTSWWKSVEPAAKDPILGVTEAFLADPSPDKVNVGVVSSLLLFSFLPLYKRD